MAELGALDMNDVMVFFFVLTRMSGVIFLNPIFGRRNLPNMVKIGLSLSIAIFAVQQIQGVMVINYSTGEILLVLIKEFAIGYCMGFIIQLFLAIFHIGGGVMDLQMGLGMASLYDPTTGSQISITGNLMTIMFTLLFFITNSHIRFLAIAIKSFDVVPLGLVVISSKIGMHMAELFGFILAYALQLALPLIVTQFIVEVAVGIMMRVVPNINVFVVNLQLKLGIGLIVLFTIIPIVARYLEKLNMIMLENIHNSLQFLM